MLLGSFLGASKRRNSEQRLLDAPAWRTRPGTGSRLTSGIVHRGCARVVGRAYGYFVAGLAIQIQIESICSELPCISSPIEPIIGHLLQ